MNTGHRTVAVTFTRVIVMVLAAVLILASCTILPEAAAASGGRAIIFTIDAGQTDGTRGVLGGAADYSNMMNRMNKEGWDTSLSQANALATPANLAAAFASVAATVKPYERVLFYYSGHGAEAGVFETEESIVLYTAASHGTANFITPSELKAMVKPIVDKGAHLIIILDSCFSGGFVADGSYANDLPWDTASDANYVPDPAGWGFSQAFDSWVRGTVDQRQGHGLYADNLWVIGAAGPREESYGNSEGGIFTNALLATATTKGDVNGDKVISLFEAYRSARRSIEIWWNTKYPGSAYLPHITGTYSDIKLFERL